MHGKDISKVSKIVLAVLLVATFWVSWLFKLDIQPYQIVLCYCVAYGIVAGTIDVNIFTDKLLGRKE